MIRRDAIRNLSVLPLAGAAMESAFPLESIIDSPNTTSSPKRDLFKELGLLHSSMPLGRLLL